VLDSLVEFLPRPTLEDTGLPQQVEIFERVRARTGQAPPVVDARDVAAAPERLLRLLCEALDVQFTPGMLSWPPGPRDTDGVWARHWYAKVWRTTGFAPPRPSTRQPVDELKDLGNRCVGYYERLAAHRLG
jgi:hypothetical protein